MKAKDLRPGDLIAYDNDPRGHVKIVDIDNRWFGLDNGVRVRLSDNSDITMYEELHPNTADVLEAVYRELTALLDGAVDAPNVWRWTVMRLRNRVAEVTPRHRLRETDVPVFLNVAAPTGNERPNEHWNARLIREQAEGSSQQAK